MIARKGIDGKQHTNYPGSKKFGKSPYRSIYRVYPSTERKKFESIELTFPT